jgi:uncharacterized 2Fe-2S/4Fe-4S cluster protein (DUF4445 family)
VVNKEFILVDRQHSGNGQDITIQRKDVNEIMLAKGAIRTGIDILLRAAGIILPEDGDFSAARPLTKPVEEKLVARLQGALKYQTD